MTYNRLIKYTEMPEIMDLQEALGVPETGVMDEQTVQTLALHIEESGFAESKYFLELLKEEQPEDTEAFLLETAAEAILKEFYKNELEKIHKFLKECYDSKMKEKGVEVIEVEYDPTHYNSEEYQRIFEKGGKIYKFGDKQYLRYDGGGSVTLTSAELKQQLLNKGYDQEYVNKMTQGFTDKTNIRLNRDESGNITFNVLGPTNDRGFGRRSDRFGIGTEEKSTGFLKGVFGQKKSGTKARRLNLSKALFDIGQSLDYNSTASTEPEPEVQPECVDGDTKTSGGISYKCVNGKFVKVETEPQPDTSSGPDIDDTGENTGGLPEGIKSEQDVIDFQSYALAKGYDVGSKYLAGDKKRYDAKWGKQTQAAYDKLKDEYLALKAEQKDNFSNYIGSIYQKYMAGENPFDTSSSSEEPSLTEKGYHMDMTDKDGNGIPDDAEGIATPKVSANIASKQLEIKNLDSIIQQLNEKIAELGQKNIPISQYLSNTSGQIQSNYKPNSFSTLLKKYSNLRSRLQKAKRNIENSVIEAEKQKYIKEAEQILAEIQQSVKKQGGTIFSKFKKGGTIEIPKKSLKDALDNVIGSGLKKKESTTLSLNNSPVYTSSTLIDDEKELIRALSSTDSIEESEKIKASFLVKYPYVAKEYFDYIEEKVNKKKGTYKEEPRISNLEHKPMEHADKSGAKQVRIFQKGDIIKFPIKEETPLYNKPSLTLNNNIVTLFNNGQIKRVQQGTPEYFALLNTGWTVIANNKTIPQNNNSPYTGFSTQNINYANEEDNYAAQNVDYASQVDGYATEDVGSNDINSLITSRVNSGANLLKTGINAYLGHKNRINLKPIAEKNYGDVQTRLMSDRSPAYTQLQQGFARSQVGANRFADPNAQAVQSAMYLNTLGKLSADMQNAQLAEKQDIDNTQFLQKQQRDIGMFNRNVELQRQAQAIKAKEKQADYNVQSALSNAFVDYMTGALDHNQQAVSTYVYSTCLEKISNENAVAINKWNELNTQLENAKKAKNQAEIDRITKEKENYYQSYMAAKSELDDCYNNNIADALSKEANLGGFGVKKTNVMMKKGGKLEIEKYKASVKKEIEKDRNTYKATKLLQDYYKLLNKAVESKNKAADKSLSEVIKRIIK